MTISLIPTQNASHYFQHWINACPNRLHIVTQLAQHALSKNDFNQLFLEEIKHNPQEGAFAGALRRIRNTVLCTLIERDLSGKADLNEVVTTMSDFADFAIQTALHYLTQELSALYGTPIGEASHREQSLIVLGMGKLGGAELNVSSDIDLIYVFPENGDTVTTEPGQRSLSNQEYFTKLGQKLSKSLSEVTEDGFVFRVDMALRPHGNSGPLVASFNMVEDYLLYQGREWERYAWIKARAITGNPDDIQQLDTVSIPFIYRRYLDFGAIDALRSMHAQIRKEVKRQESLHPDRSNNVKLGRGGIREIEFIAQVFQLIRGGRDLQLRDRSTRETLHVLAQKHLLEPAIVDQLLAAYTFLRNLEHRIQYVNDAQTHNLPNNQDDLLAIAKTMGYQTTEALLQELETCRTFVAGQFDEIFHDSTQDESQDTTVCDITEQDDVDAIRDTLTAVQFPEAEQTAQRLYAALHSPKLRHISENSLRQLVRLVNLAISQLKDDTDHAFATLNRFLDFLETVARRAAYLALLTEYPYTLQRLLRILSASQWAAQYLNQHPILLDELLDNTTLHGDPDWQQFEHDCLAQLALVPDDTERQMDILREMHHSQLFRLLAKDLEGDLPMERLADYLTELADILVRITLKTIWQTLPHKHREDPLFAVIAYGKLGGKELSYASDLDVVFLYQDDDQEAPALYAKLAQRFITWMTTHTSAGILFDIDIALRPDGASGLMVSSFSNFEKYQHHSAWLWEHQALTRARFCAGDQHIGQEFEVLREAVLRQSRDQDKLKQEITTMRQRMRDAHPNHSDLFDLKQDKGGMIDIEFMVQYLVLRYAHEHPELVADIGNIALLKLSASLQLIDDTLANQVADAYRHFRKQQHLLRLQGIENAKINPAKIEQQVNAVNQLWDQVFQ